MTPLPLEGLKNMFDMVCICCSIKDENVASCHRRPANLDIHSSDVESRSSLVSVADHVEHLTDTAMGRFLSFCSDFLNYVPRAL